MSIEVQLLMWWFLFGGTHVLGSTVPVRKLLIRLLGLGGFKGLYSLVAAGTFIPLVWTYWDNRHEGAMLFDPEPWSVHLAEGLMLLAFLFLVLGFMTPNPSTTVSEMTGSFASSPRGIHRVTRHPMNTAFVLFGLAHLSPNPTVGDWVFFGGFIVYGVVSAFHQDRRLLASGPEAFKSFHAETSALPFGAVLTGRQRLALGEIRWVAVGVAMALFALIRWFHPVLIGGFR